MVKDPEALKNWPLTLSRDGPRTPLPWASGESHAGFSSVDPCLPPAPPHTNLAADRHQPNPEPFHMPPRLPSALPPPHPPPRPAPPHTWTPQPTPPRFDS